MTTNTASSALTEEHLAEVTPAVTDVVGEEGLSRLIGANIRDCFRLDPIGRIRSATSFESVINEMRQYRKDASICLVGLKVLFSMVPKDCESGLHEVLDDREAFSVTRVVLSCLLRHLADKSIQKRGLDLLLNIVSLHYCDAMIRLLSSGRGITTIVSVLEHYPVNATIQRTAWATLVAVKNQAVRQVVLFASFTAEAETLIPTIFAALENHSTDSSIIPLAFAILCTIGVRAIIPGPLSENRVRQAFYEYFDAHPEWSGIFSTAFVNLHDYNMETAHLLQNMNDSLIKPVMEFFKEASEGLRN